MNRRTAILIGFLAAMAAAGPCEDPQYVALKARPVADLTAGEVTYLMEYDRRCAEATEDIQDSIRHEATAKKISKGASIGIFFAVVAFVAAIVVPIVAMRKAQRDAARDVENMY